MGESHSSDVRKGWIYFLVNENMFQSRLMTCSWTICRNSIHSLRFYCSRGTGHELIAVEIWYLSCVFRSGQVSCREFLGNFSVGSIHSSLLWRTDEMEWVPLLICQVFVFIYQFCLFHLCLFEINCVLISTFSFSQPVSYHGGATCWKLADVAHFKRHAYKCWKV